MVTPKIKVGKSLVPLRYVRLPTVKLVWLEGMVLPTNTRTLSVKKPVGFASLQVPQPPSRLDRDVLDQTGVTHIIVADMALNDIGNARENPTPTSDDLIAGMKQLIDRAHTRGVKIYGATLTPFEGAGYFTQVGEVKRQKVNQWIRTSKAYDAVIDFDTATQDPSHPIRFLPLYDSGDHLHPNDTGNRAMAESIDLSLFKAAPAVTRTSSSR